MNPIKLIIPLWKLIRGNNLLIICLILLLVRHTIVLPILSFSETSSELSDHLFLLLMLATVLIAAGGNIINDYFDMVIDAINKPGGKVLGNQISKTAGLRLYIIFTLAGIGLSGFVSFKLNTYQPFVIFPASALILFLYSYSYKSVMLAGNLLIALLGSITVALPMLFDNGAIGSETILILVSGYSVFAFLITLSREIIKDCEDIDGDRQNGCSTFPVKHGEPSARKTASVIAFLLLAALVWVQYSQRQWDDMRAFIYVTLFIDLPLLILI